ncbi:unnamed protein product [Leptosia nina]|uniref:Afadin n=1 Tax=Leptosia nina TaxID=320188 RepID=A0AAV1JZE0_9NEOP
MDAADKRMLDREALRNMIQQWNANRLDLFELSEPNENLEFHGVMRFYFQDSGQKIATKCIRVASDATVSDVIETLIEKFRPDMRMLSLGSYSLWETHGPDDERKLEPHEKPLLVQLNWHADDREGRFLLKCSTGSEMPLSSVNEKADQNFKRKLSKREKKELKKKEKLSRLKSDTNDENRPVAEKLYTELPETSFTRSISNPEAVMRRRRQQKLERKLQQFRSKDGGPDTGGTLKIYGSSLSPDVPYKTLLLSVGDNAASIVREMLEKYGLSRHDPLQYCIVQVDAADNSEYILEDDECPLAIVMTHPHRGSIMFHVRRRPSDAQPRRRKKKAGSNASAGARPGTEPMLIEVTPDGAALENGRRVRVTDIVEVGSGNGTALQLYGPSIQPRHCVVATADGGGYTVTPLHADAQVYVNGRRTMHSARLQHGCLLKFGRVSTFRFVDPAQENLINRNLSQSQNYGSGSIYDRSTGDSGAMSPTSLASQQPEHLDANANDAEYPTAISPVSHDTYPYTADTQPYNNNTLKLDNESLMMSPHMNDSKDDYIRDEHSVYNEQEPNRGPNSQYKDNYETTFDLDGNVETKSICSAKSGGSGQENRSGSGAWRAGQEAILPAVLEFPEAGQAQFLAAVITRLDPHAPAFKLAPVYTLYLCARYRASTHYRPELTPTERAHKLTAFLHHVATLIHATVQERCSDSAAQAFWMANASELLHFLKCDRHISSFSTQAQELLPTTVQNAFSNLVSCFQEELRVAVSELARPGAADDTEATAPVLQALAAAMVLLRRCRVNAALTIQLFSHLFHFINAIAFNKLISEPSNISPRWGAALSARLALLAAWAERQGLELAADCHLARTHRAARLIQGEYRTADDVRAALAACFKLNSVQVRALLTPLLPPDLVEAAVAHARALADELYRADGREIRLEESEWLGAALLIPGDGFSAEVVRGVPPGLAEFVAPLQRGGFCRLAHQPHALGLWTVYMHSYGSQPRRPPDPRPQIIQLHKNTNGMGLSIVAAKGAGQSKLGIYIKSVVAGGAAAADGRLAAGDQLLSVDGHSLVGISQEKAAEYLVRTGPTVTLEVAKQGAVLHGLATLLHQPTYTQQRQGYGRRPNHSRCHLLRNMSSESSTTDDSEEFLSYYHGSIPRLIVTLDRENNELQDDLSPETPNCPELSCGSISQRQIPIFTFTCDEDDVDSSNLSQKDTHVPYEIPPPVPEPPLNYEQTYESGEHILPPEMKPISTRLMLDLCNPRATDCYTRRCTGVGDCVSACDCCRTPQPETQQIPYIDEPNYEPIIFEKDGVNEKIVTPKVRRILPSLSLDKSEERPAMADAMCQTPPSPSEIEAKPITSSKVFRQKFELGLKLNREFKNLQDTQSRLKRTIFNMSKSLSSKSDETEETSTASIKEPLECLNVDKRQKIEKGNVIDTKTLAAEKKSWKSPDEYRPPFGKVKELTKRFNQINLTYCVKNYKRNCQSSPNLSVRPDMSPKHKLSLPTSVSLADVQCEQSKKNTSSSKSKLSEEEVKSILIQLEDWSKFGSRGSEDTLAQGNEFELPNLPSEDHTDTNASIYDSLVFNEIDKTPRVITLDNIKLKQCNGSVKSSKDSCITQSTGKYDNSSAPRIVGILRRAQMSSTDVSTTSRLSKQPGWSDAMVQSCPELSTSDRFQSCPTSLLLSSDTTSRGGAGGVVGTGARRASERDLPSRLAAEPVKPSKSTPALHHAAPQPAPQPHPHPLPPAHHHYTGPLSPGGQSAGNSSWATKSRSSHNLSTPHGDSFYQNLSSVHDKQDSRWSSLRSSGSGRPQSAHFNATEPNSDLSPLQQQHQLSQANARAAKLAEMSEEVTRRQQMQHQHLQQQQNMQTQQMQYQKQMPQMYVQTGYGQGPAGYNSSPQGLQNLGSQHGLQNVQGSMHGLQNQGSMLGLQNMHGSVQGLQNIQGSMQALQALSPQNQQPSPQLHGSQYLHSQNQMHYHNQHVPPQRYEWHQPGPPSPQRSQPPVAPKPQGPRRSEIDIDDLSQHSQQSHNMTNAIQPDEEHYVASALEPPAVSVYGTSGAGNAGRQEPAHNPWQREERERQAEARRAAARARRDAAIAQLVALGASRTPVQNQQLRALQLERDFERRATQHEQDDGGNGEGSPEDESPSSDPVMENDRESRSSHGSYMAQPQPQMQPSQPQPQPPKSILKTNRSEMVNGYPPHVITNEENRIAELSTNISNMSVSASASMNNNMNVSNMNASSNDIVPPAPPERGSSFAVMATRRALSPHQPPQSPVGTTRDKRVSFHERASENHDVSHSVQSPQVPPAAQSTPTGPPAPPASSPPPLETPITHREDPDRFIEEAENMLSATSASTNTSHTSPLSTHTPGVIGAQEVYRDPRARRLAEQQAKAAPAPIPEHLSFKEKMKMFALESGEASTPKDKVKISRAQRDIDAVH